MEQREVPHPEPARSAESKDAPSRSGRNLHRCRTSMREHVPETRIACRVDALPALRDAARAGPGLALLPCYVGDPAPGLRRAAPRPPAAARSALWLLTHDDLKRTARIRAVMDFLAIALAADRPLFEGKRAAGGGR
jgi:DNA-binding transcriptional LysR family regulator